MGKNILKGLSIAMTFVATAISLTNGFVRDKLEDIQISEKIKDAVEKLNK